MEAREGNRGRETQLEAVPDKLKLRSDIPFLLPYLIHQITHPESTDRMDLDIRGHQGRALTLAITESLTECKDLNNTAICVGEEEKNPLFPYPSPKLHDYKGWPLPFDFRGTEYPPDSVSSKDESSLGDIEQQYILAVK